MKKEEKEKKKKETCKETFDDPFFVSFMGVVKIEGFEMVLIMNIVNCKYVYLQLRILS